LMRLGLWGAAALAPRPPWAPDLRFRVLRHCCSCN
jgi:hypothetical protein